MNIIRKNFLPCLFIMTLLTFSNDAMANFTPMSCNVKSFNNNKVTYTIYGKLHITTVCYNRKRSKIFFLRLFNW